MEKIMEEIMATLKDPILLNDILIIEVQ